ncbi:MAG TPA: alpha/beta hydrolase fold domain-containing protein [Archangium sp.]|nr:alpha/beta hydrolase fold domain-containing protein [Archangium sp.]
MTSLPACRTDPTRVAVAGDSAGGNLAASVAPALRGTSPGLVHQVLAGLIDAAHDARRLIGERLREAFGS